MSGDDKYITKISNCYNVGNIKSSGNSNNAKTGGIVGGMSPGDTGVVEYCYNIGIINGKGSLLGSIIGYKWDGRVQNCYYSNKSSVKAIENEDDSENNVYGLDDASMSTSNFVDLLNHGEENIWKMGDNNYNYPVLEWQEDTKDILPNKQLTNITITRTPSKTEYIEGQTFDRERMQVTAHYNDETTAVVDNYTISPTRALQISDKSITVSYEENGITQTAEQEITVKAKSLDRIAIENEPTKKNYTEGDTLNTQGLTIRAYYNNGTNEVITNGFTCSPTTLNTVGTQKITVTYQNKTATFNVTVTAKQEPKPEKLLKGDVNGDGKVDFLDILAINKHRLGKTLLKGIYLEAADVNGDNVADFKDILQINKYRLGKINSI